MMIESLYTLTCMGCGHVNSVHLKLHGLWSGKVCIPELAWVMVTKTRSGELRTQKLKSYLVRTQSLNVLHFKPGVGQYIAIHATLTAREFFLLISTLPVHSPAFFPKPLPIFFPVLAVANTSSCVGPQNRICHPVGCRFPC